MELKECLRPNLIQIKQSPQDWEEAIRMVGRILVADGATEPRYIDGMIRVAHEFGPYIVIAPGFAMPHARPEDGVIRTSMSMITLSEPLNFGNEDNDPVRVVLALAAANHDDHVGALAQLAEAISGDGVIDQLAEANSVEEVYEILGGNA